MRFCIPLLNQGIYLAIPFDFRLNFRVVFSGRGGAARSSGRNPKFHGSPRLAGEARRAAAFKRGKKVLFLSRLGDETAAASSFLVSF